IKYVVDKNFKDITCFQRLCARSMYQHINFRFTEPKLQKASFKAAKAYNDDDHIFALHKLDHYKRSLIEAGGQTNWAGHLYDPSASCHQIANILSK
ncbi:hypothetical protein MKX01_020564, partial [Papaver californicum]